jgi:hypothetical protein
MRNIFGLKPPKPKVEENKMNLSILNASRVIGIDESQVFNNNKSLYDDYKSLNLKKTFSFL